MLIAQIDSRFIWNSAVWRANNGIRTGSKSSATRVRRFHFSPAVRVQNEQDTSREHVT